MERTGEVHRVSGPVVTATGITPKMYDVVLVGDEGLMGEVIEIHHEKSVVQVYEDTSGVRPGESRIRDNRRAHGARDGGDRARRGDGGTGVRLRRA